MTPLSDSALQAALATFKASPNEELIWKLRFAIETYLEWERMPREIPGIYGMRKARLEGKRP